MVAEEQAQDSSTIQSCGPQVAMMMHDANGSGEMWIEGWALESAMMVEEIPFGRCYDEFCAETTMFSNPDEDFYYKPAAAFGMTSLKYPMGGGKKNG